MSNTQSRSYSAFTLVEVVLALGVVAFCLLSVFGLLPIGVNSNHNSLEQTGAANLARGIVADLRATPSASGTGSVTSYLFQIPIPSPTATLSMSTTGTTESLYFREDGSVVTTFGEHRADQR